MQIVLRDSAWEPLVSTAAARFSDCLICSRIILGNMLGDIWETFGKHSGTRKPKEKWRRVLHLKAWISTACRQKRTPCVCQMACFWNTFGRLRGDIWETSGTHFGKHLRNILGYICAQFGKHFGKCWETFWETFWETCGEHFGAIWVSFRGKNYQRLLPWKPFKMYLLDYLPTWVYQPWSLISPRSHLSCSQGAAFEMLRKCLWAR